MTNKFKFKGRPPKDKLQFNEVVQGHVQNLDDIYRHAEPIQQELINSSINIGIKVYARKCLEEYYATPEELYNNLLKNKLLKPDVTIKGFKEKIIKDIEKVKVNDLIKSGLLVSAENLTNDADAGKFAQDVGVYESAVKKLEDVARELAAIARDEFIKENKNTMNKKNLDNKSREVFDADYRSRYNAILKNRDDNGVIVWGDSTIKFPDQPVEPTVAAFNELGDGGITLRETGIKQQERARSKVKNRYKGDCKQLCDVNRIGLQIKEVAVVNMVKEEFTNSYTIMDEGFKLKPISGFYDSKLALAIKGPDGRHSSAEVQITSVKQHDVARVTSDIYKVMRMLTGEGHKYNEEKSENMLENKDHLYAFKDGYRKFMNMAITNIVDPLYNQTIKA